MAAAGAGPGAGEDHIVHAAGPHGLGGIGSHDPAQGFQQVGLAAAIGPDDARESGFDPKLRRLDKGLEARKTKLLELHVAPWRPDALARIGQKRRRDLKSVV